MQATGIKRLSSVFDVADYFLNRQDDDCQDIITNLKLQKLCYYAQGFYLALNRHRLFNEDIEAWQHGPVIPVLYEKYKKFGSGALPISEDFNLRNIPDDVQDLLDEVYSEYGQYSAWKLRNMTHCEPPWQNAIKKNEVLSDQDMINFFKTQLASEGE